MDINIYDKVIAVTLPVQIHSVKRGWLRCRPCDVARLYLILDAVEFVDSIQHVVPQGHADVILWRLNKKSTFIYFSRTVPMWLLVLMFLRFLIHSRLCCRGTRQTCFLSLWLVCVGVVRLTCSPVSAGTERRPCRPSDPPGPWVDEAPHGRRLWTSWGLRSGAKISICIVRTVILLCRHEFKSLRIL